MSEITIDKNIPVPDAKRRKQYKKTLDAMSIGDSFLAPLADRNNLSANINHYFHSGGEKRFQTSSDSQPDGMFRIWRIKDEVKPIN